MNVVKIKENLLGKLMDKNLYGSIIIISRKKIFMNRLVNAILDTDSYKFSQYPQYPPKMK